MKPQSSDNGGLDALLGRWPALDPQAKGGLSWEERADKIVTAVLARKDQTSADDVEALLAPPRLEAEPGEEKAASFQIAGGETQPMSNDQPSQPKRPSLKELAARASQSGAGRASVTPLPPSMRSASAPASVPATVTPISKAKAARASDAGHEDSGVLRLADLQANEAAKAEAAATAAEAALASASAKRAEDRQTAAAATVAQPAAASGKSSTGMWAGVAVAVLGLAAAFTIYKTRQPEVAPAKTAQTEPQKTPATEAPKPQAAAEATVAAAAEPAPLASAAPSDAPKADEPKGEPGAAAPTAVAVGNNDVKAAQPAASAKAGSVVGTLDEEMKKAVGANNLPDAPQDDGSKPASGGASGNIPEQPSQGNAQAAIRAVMPGAKACVAGAPEPSSANVTFSSSGAVQSVSVSGWAAANGKAACVKGALQGARVSPFAKASFTAPVTIRP